MKGEVKHFATERWAELAAFHQFYPEKQLADRVANQTSVFADLVSETNKANLPCQGKQLGVFVASGTVWAFKRMLIFWKTYVCHCHLDNIPPEDFSDEARADTECDLRMQDEMCQHWARLHHFPPHLYFRRFKGELVRN